ncbi:hypothetical protein B7L70_07110 [Vulcanisaeta sp. EB80]|uniref:hypothetical protein n=1 Tax=Vulcanisaeta sp. EB80 TaxID=1650660 RepID=UPI0009BEA49E|nr:hypothetical protein [Vulcanisaeta sp. EB80]PLC67736.1 hypothetical protein B7L70_07110 [Vulcanisaeta sp. EB80]
MDRKGQGLLITAMVIVIAVLVLAILYRVFTMTPAYVYQRSIYYAFKENPQVVVQQLDEEIQAIVATFAINYSNSLINEGLYLYLHALTQSPVSYSLASVIGAQINILVNSIYVPTGIAIPTTKPKPHVSITTGFYGALKIKGVKYIYSAGNESSIAVVVKDTYNMPTLGIQNLTLRNSVSLAAWIVKPQNPSILNPTTITTETRCIFNFKLDNYTCTGPATYTTGNASYLWAPYFAGGMYRTSNMGWVAGGQTASLAFAIPIDELAANAGFNISATFDIANCTAGQQVCAGIQFLTPWPTEKFQNYQDRQGYSVVITSSSVKLYYGNSQYQLKLKKCSPPFTGLTNLTLYVKPTKQLTWQNVTNVNNEPQANLYVYINNTLCNTTTIYLPVLVNVSNTVFNNNAYMLSGQVSNVQQSQQLPLLGSWTAIILQNAAVINASIKLYNNYTLPRNVLVTVSYNNAPALGASIIGLNVTPTLGYSEISLKYTVYNITSNAVVFNVTMPPPNGYPNTQYLLLINYSNIRLILNPWSPAALSAMGINSTTPSGYSATSLIPYMAFIYNQTSGSLIEVTYFINTGVPTALTIYGGGTGLYITNITNGQTYAALGTVEPLPWMNIFKVNNAYPMGVLSILTFNESIYNLAPGYAVIGQIIPLSEMKITRFGEGNYPSALYNWITEYEHFPNQTLPYAYVYPTIMNCQYPPYENSYISYENSYIYFAYNNGQLLYYGYTPNWQLNPCQGW